MNRLYVFGDSFAAPFANAATWTQQVADQLNLEMVNHARPGTSQDYAWAILQHYIPEFTAQDRIVIVLTHPSRQWYFQNKPFLSNINIIDLDQHLTREETQAVELYIKHIQRPQRDSLDVSMRLGWLAWQCHARGLAKPIVIQAFEQDIVDPLCVDNMLMAQGSLYQVDMAEFTSEIPEERINDFWMGHDPRYNHLCLTNHAILANKIVQSFASGCAPDLTEGFVGNILSNSTPKDQEFVAREFNPINADVWLEARHKKRSFVPWRAKVGISRNVGG